MLIVISPAKKLDFDSAPITDQYTQPNYLKDADELVNVMKNHNQSSLAKMMKLSDKLSALNVQRYKDYTTPFTPQNAKAALLAFKGDVYAGMNAETFTQDNLLFAQSHLRILSGLYGLLKPLDLIQAYRLEMGTKLDTSKGQNLYEFWDNKITDGINQALAQSGSDVLINLASKEYFKAVKSTKINGAIITPQFKEEKNGEFKIIGIYAKRARGLMSRYIIENEIEKIDEIKQFNWEGYRLCDELSSQNQWVFTRPTQATSRTQ